ncbi:hypothetical protein E6O75_ATG10409 [Venturia nashicola]|uniref:Uncharacterized protein n=1 Tax=Venturia nashicola TaxID=86259 RepID=A0A4Z1P1Q6_9PEZI|nr:hypothetical protein E6O75_ATG10409 [Venturia nashicola]
MSNLSPSPNKQSQDNSFRCRRSTTATPNAQRNADGEETDEFVVDKNGTFVDADDDSEDKKFGVEKIGGRSSGFRRDDGEGMGGLGSVEVW